jgi:ATP adenylyltransferase
MVGTPRCGPRTVHTLETSLNHEQLWAPWRLGYIQGEQLRPPNPAPDANWLPGADRDCFICRATAERQDRQNLVVERGQQMLTILNRYPYNNGHLLVAPARHIARLEEMIDAEHVEAMQTIARLVSTLERTMRAEGFNIGLNLGRVAGAGLPGHLHWHVVPRWNGDTNFMPTLAGIKVIPQALDELWGLLTSEIAK